MRSIWCRRVLAVVLLCAGYSFADSYIGRLSNHAGYWLVPVEDRLSVEPSSRPRHTIVVVVDGLRLDAAERMRSAARLRAQGQCGPMRVPVPTVSRPVYAMLSTGLEQDRTGARNNDETSPLAAESIWEVARRAGLRVQGRSELPWFRQLFPRGFDDYAVIDDERSVFLPKVTADLTLFHPTLVDETAHRHGAASSDYARAVQQIDQQLEALLDSVDGSQDLVVLTADHGHRARGGHGGPQLEVATVLTCFAGKGVVRGATPAGLEARSLAPILSVLLGVHFPRHLRAGKQEDTLDQVFSVVDERTVGSAYLADRRAAIERFRDANRRQLLDWSGGTTGTWSGFYARAAQRQLLRAGACVALFGMVVAWACRRRSRNENARTALWLLAAIAAQAAGYALLARGLDATSLNRRDLFVFNTLVGSGVGLGVVAAAHLAIVRDLGALARDLAALLIVLLAINVGHVIAFGWPLGFPVPGPYLYFLPFLSSTFLVTASVWAGLVAVFERRR